MPAISNYNLQRYQTREVVTPGSYEFVSASIGSGLRTEDFLNKILAMNVYESLHTPYLTFEVFCLDTENLVSELPIQGGEIVTITVRDCHRETRTHTFRVTKVSDRRPESVSSLTYTIHGVTSNVVFSHTRKISESHIKMRPERIMESVLTEHMRFPSSDFLYDPGAEDICCVLPNWRPLEALMWLNSRNQSRRFPRSPYKTFMTVDEEIYHTSLDLLYNDGTNVSRGPLYTYFNRQGQDGTSLISDDRMTRHLYSFTNFDNVKTAELLENLTQGMFSTRVQEVDVFERKDENHYHTYATEFNQTEHLGRRPYRIDGVTLAGLENTADQGVTSPHWRTILRHPGLFSQEDIASKPENYIADHTSKLQQMENYKIKGVLPGSFELKVGQKYSIDIPQYSNVESGNTIQSVDRLMSGDFVVENIKHSYSPTLYTARCLFFKDALEL